MSTRSVPPRELVLASAGSGKTYRISSRLIGLLARGEEPRSILASTFTRKAAGAILQRVLVRLATAAQSEDAAAALASDALPTETKAGSAFWSDLLARTIAELHCLNIGTLDSFFVRAARTFAHDLGLPPRWEIADEPTQERIRAEAVDRVLERTDTAKFVRLLRALHSDSVRRSVHDGLVGEIDAIVSVHRSLAADAPGWRALREVAAERPPDFAERVRQVASRIERAQVPLTAGGKQSQAWAKALPEVAGALRSRRWEGVVEKGPGLSLLNSAESEPASYTRVPFTAELLEAIREAIDLAGGEVRRELAARAEAMGELAATYVGAFESGLLASGRPGFEDVTRMLLEGRVLGSRDELVYRLDSASKHLLLDEFQDTSVLQWRALVPLADALDGSGGATVVVADPKQSIYGWRGAAPSVVRAFGDRYALPEESMATSWRSSQFVLDAVNRVFERIAEAPVLGQDERDAETARKWCEAFRAHEAARQGLPGHVLLVAGPAKEGRPNRQPKLSRFAAERIGELHRRAPGRSLGVLTRSNDEVARLIFELGRLGVPASEEGGTGLVDSGAVVSLLALLRLVDHPGDGLARYHVASTPVGAVTGLTDWNAPNQAHRVARAMRRRLLEDGYGRTLSALAHGLGDALGERDQGRVRRLVELGYAWDASGSGSGLRVDDFVRRAETERAESPGEIPVRVMTIHGSKGLEFDAVVLPQLHSGMLGGPSDSAPLGYRPVEAGPVTHAFPYVNRVVLPLLANPPELSRALAQRRAERLRDALGILYVGMTRARYALHLIVPADGSGKVTRALTPARVLRETLSDVPALEPVVEGTVLHESGRADWMDRLPVPGRLDGAGPAPVPVVIHLRTDAPRSRGLDRRAPSGPGASETVDFDRILGVGRHAGGMTRGSVVHAWLESLEWLESGLASDRELLVRARHIAPGWPPEQTDAALAELKDQLQASGIAGVLRRSSWPEGTRVERELPFLARDGDTLLEGVIDRLHVVPGQDGAIVEAVVVDYKTDRPGADPEAEDPRMRHYRWQIDTYARAVRQLYGLAGGQVKGLLLFLESGRVEEVTGA